MFKVLIDKEITGVFNDDGLEGINNNDMIGFLINTNGIKELISSMPITSYYINKGFEGKEKISQEQAMMIYDKILEYSKDTEKTTIKM